MTSSPDAATGTEDHHDEKSLSKAALECANTSAAERGFVFSVSEDFDELLAVNEINRGNWDPLMPQFHSGYFDTKKASAFWIKGVDSSGTVMAARAHRRFDLPPGQTLHDALVDLSLFYDDPKKAGPQEHLETSALMPRAVSGSFVFAGAVWIYPAARRLGLASLMWPVGRAVTYDRWNVPLQIALVEDAVKMRSVIGFENMEFGILWKNSYVAPECRFTLVWWTRDEIARAVNRFIATSSLQ